MKTLVAVLSMIVCFSSYAASSSLKCHGTEPFWGLTVSGKKIELNLAAESKTITQKIEKNILSANNSRTALIETKDVMALLTEESCGDGMSDEVFPRSISVLYKNDVLLTGCCN